MNRPHYGQNPNLRIIDDGTKDRPVKGYDHKEECDYVILTLRFVTMLRNLSATC